MEFLFFSSRILASSGDSLIIRPSETAISVDKLSDWFLSSSKVISPFANASLVDFHRAKSSDLLASRYS